MAERHHPWRQDESSSIRRPAPGELGENALVAGLRDSAERLAGLSRPARIAGASLARTLAVLFILPAVLLPLFVGVGAVTPWAREGVIAVYLALALFGYSAWHDVLKRDWRNRLRRRGERLEALEDTSLMRRHALIGESATAAEGRLGD